MPLRAVCHCCMAGFRYGGGVAEKYVIALGERPQMGRIDAGTNTATMVDDHPCWDRSTVALIGEGRYTLGFVVKPAASVAVTVKG